MAGGMTVGTLQAYMRLDDSQFNSSADKSEKRFGGLRDAASGVMSSIWGTAKLAGAGILSIGAIGAKAGIQTASGLEQANVAFTTMLGSGQAASAFLTDLQQFAAATPFEFPDLVTASQRLMAMGVASKDVKPYLTAIGDAVAGLGGGADQVNQVTTAIGQMAAKGKIQSDEMMQLTEAGIPALRILADSYGVTTAKMQDNITKGIVPSSEALPKLIAGLENGTKSVKGFGGMMAGQSQTMAGLWSTLMDTLNMGASTVMQPLIPLIKQGIGGATEFAAAQMPKMAAGIAGIVAKAQALYSLVVESDYNGQVRAAFGWEEDSPMVGKILKIGWAAKGLYDFVVKGDFNSNWANAFNISDDSPTLGKLFTIRNAIIGLTDLVVTGHFNEKLNWAFGWNENNKTVEKIQGIRDAILGFKVGDGLDKVKAFFASLSGEDVGNGTESASNGLLKLINSLTGVAHALGTGVIGGAKLLGAALTFLGDHIGTIIKFMPLIIAAFIAWKAAQTAANLAAIASLPIQAAQVASNFALASANKALAAALGYTRTSMLSTMLQGIKTTASLVWSAITTAASTVAAAATVVGGWALMAAGAALNAAIVVGSWIAMGVQSMLQAARMAAAWIIALGPIAWVTAAVIAIGVLIYENWDKIVGWTKSAWETVSNLVMGAVNWVVSFVQDHWQLLVAILTGPIGLAVMYLKGHWDSITSSVGDMVGSVRAKFLDFVGLVTGIPGRILGAIGSGGQLLKGFGHDLIQGLIDAFHLYIAGFFALYIELPGKVLGFMGDGLQLLKSYGKDIVQGLINGALEMLDKAKNLGSKIGGALKDGVSSVWHFGSPSKVARQMGQWIGAGLALGTDDSLRGVTNSADRLGKAATPSLTIPSYPTSTQAGAPFLPKPGDAPGAAAWSRTVNVELNNYGPRVTASEILTEVNVADVMSASW